MINFIICEDEDVLASNYINVIDKFMMNNDAEYKIHRYTGYTKDWEDYAKNEKDAIEEANFVLDNIKGYNIEMPIAFDWESFNYFNAGQMNLFDLRGASNAFLKTIKDAGYTPVHYASKSYLEYIWLPVDYDIWLAHYTKETSYKGDYVMWQLSSNGKVDGINNYVDINVYYKN